MEAGLRLHGSMLCLGAWRIDKTNHRDMRFISPGCILYS